MIRILDVLSGHQPAQRWGIKVAGLSASGEHNYTLYVINSQIYIPTPPNIPLLLVNHIDVAQAGLLGVTLLACGGLVCAPE